MEETEASSSTTASGGEPNKPSRLRRIRRLVFVSCVVVVSAIGLLAALGHGGQAKTYPGISNPPAATTTVPQLPLTHLPPDLNVGATTSTLQGTGGFADLTVNITNLNTTTPVVWPTLYFTQNGKFLPIMGDGYGGCQPDGNGAACPAISDTVPQPELGPGQTLQETIQISGSSYDPSQPITILAGGNGVAATPVEVCSVAGGPGNCSPPPAAKPSAAATPSSTTSAKTTAQASARRPAATGASLA